MVNGEQNMESIEDFGIYAEQWWSEKSWVNPLKDLNNFRIPFIQKSLINSGILSELSPHKKFPLEGVKILDVGCGGGILSEGLCKKGAEVTGIDPSSEVIEIAKIHSEPLSVLASKGPRYFAHTIGTHSQIYQEYYDCVVCSEVIEHVDDKEVFLEECLKALKPNGSIILTTPHKTILAYFSYVTMAEYILRRNPIGTHHWGKFISLQGSKNILKSKGCKIEKTKHVYFNPVTKKWHWSTITPPFNYFLHGVKTAEICNQLS